MTMNPTLFIQSSGTFDLLALMSLVLALTNLLAVFALIGVLTFWVVRSDLPRRGYGIAFATFALVANLLSFLARMATLLPSLSPHITKGWV